MDQSTVFGCGKTKMSFRVLGMFSRSACTVFVGFNRWIDDEGKEQTERYFRAPDEHDIAREGRSFGLLGERFRELAGIAASSPRDASNRGKRPTSPFATRGWTHWHHLFNPRQLLVLGTLMEETGREVKSKAVAAAMLLGMSRCADYNARLSRWHPRSIGDKSEQTFSNQALNHDCSTTPPGRLRVWNPHSS